MAPHSYVVSVCVGRETKETSRWTYGGRRERGEGSAGTLVRRRRGPRNTHERRGGGLGPSHQPAGASGEHGGTQYLGHLALLWWADNTLRVTRLGGREDSGEDQKEGVEEAHPGSEG